MCLQGVVLYVGWASGYYYVKWQANLLHILSTIAMPKSCDIAVISVFGQLERY